MIAALAVVLVFTLWSCSSSDDGDDDDDDFNPGDDDDYSGDTGWENYLDVLPDEAGLTLVLPEESKTKALGEMAVWYDDTVDFTRDVNGHVLLFLSHIDEITSYPPTSQSGNTYYWGPWTDPYAPPTSVEMQFEMTQNATENYDYYLQFRPKDSQDDWTVVWEGHITAVSANTARRGVGDFTVYFTDAKALDPTINESGTINVDYDTSGPGREINIAYYDFFSEEWGDDGPPEPIDATYTYTHNADDSGDFLFDWYDDIHKDTDPQYDEMEHLWFHTRWDGGGPGRTDVTVVDGDLPQIGLDNWGSPIDEWTGSECWDDDFLRVYYMDRVELGDGTVYDGTPEGIEADCAFDAQFPI